MSITAKNWEYGKTMLEQGDIASLKEWSDDKEYCCSVMDQEFDYLWDFSKGIHFIDRLYSDYKDANVKQNLTLLGKHFLLCTVIRI